MAKVLRLLQSRQPFEHLDNYVAKQVADYHSVIVRQLGKADHRTKPMILGVPSTAAIFEVTLENAAKQPD